VGGVEVADTVLDAIADAVEAWGQVNARVWADDAPTGPTFPYVTMDDAISTVPDVKGDGATIMLVRQVQVNLWERLADEDPLLGPSLHVYLDGRKVVVGGHTVCRLAVDSTARLVEKDDNIAHRALTISVRHDPATP
jgi:hypothetical protein